jgi:low affinity Fe/Cu permease
MMAIAMAAYTLLVPFGLTNAVTSALSVAATIITDVVLLQG